MASIGVSSDKIQHISCLKPDRLWYSFGYHIVEIDKNGLVLRELDVDRAHVGDHSMTKDGDLLFKKERMIYMLTRNGEIQNLHIHVYSEEYIHSSRINCDIFVCDKYGSVQRYDKEGCRLKTIKVFNRYLEYHEMKMEMKLEDLSWKMEMKLEDLSWKKQRKWEKEFRYEFHKLTRDSPCLITENINGDIIATDGVFRKVVAVDSDGRDRFTYQCCSYPQDFKELFQDEKFVRYGWISSRRKVFKPIGICNDLSGHILVGDTCYEDPSIHLLDKDGKFLAKLLTRECLNLRALCVDDRNNLYVGDYRKINIYTYLSDTTTKEHDSPLIESELKPKPIQI